MLNHAGFWVQASKKAKLFAELNARELASTNTCVQQLLHSSPGLPRCGGGEGLAKTARASYIWGANIKPVLEQGNCSSTGVSARPGTIPDDALLGDH